MIPRRFQGGLPGPDLVVGFGHPVGDQVLSRSASRSFTPGPEAGQVDGIDIGEIVGRNQGKFHSVTF